MRKWIMLAGAAALAGTAGLAQAESLGRPRASKPESDDLSLEALKTKVVEQGYEIRGGEIKKTRGEFDVTDKAGKKTELFVDPASGAIVSGGGASDSRGGKVAETDKDDD